MALLLCLRLLGAACGTVVPQPERGTGLPGDRLPRLRQLLEAASLTGRPLRIMETHSGLSGLVVEHARATRRDGGDGDGETEVEFDGMWSSSLTASALRGLPDIETVDTTARLALVQETLAVTTKPLIYDADTGGQPEVFRYTVRALEQLGVSACILEDKCGLKQNSLFGTDRAQNLATPEEFCAKIRAGVKARRCKDFMVIARIEALIAGAGMEEALRRARAYTEAGADAIMIHSKEKTAEQVVAFAHRYRAEMGDAALPLVAVPSSYSGVTEAELGAAGFSVCIYANQLLRATYPAMRDAAATILTNGRAREVDRTICTLPEILTLFEEKNEADEAGDADGDDASAVSVDAARGGRGGDGGGGDQRVPVMRGGAAGLTAAAATPAVAAAAADTQWWRAWRRPWRSAGAAGAAGAAGVAGVAGAADVAGAAGAAVGVDAAALLRFASDELKVDK